MSAFTLSRTSLFALFILLGGCESTTPFPQASVVSEPPPPEPQVVKVVSVSVTRSVFIPARSERVSMGETCTSGYLSSRTCTPIYQYRTTPVTYDLEFTDSTGKVYPYFSFGSDPVWEKGQKACIEMGQGERPYILNAYPDSSTLCSGRKMTMKPE